MNPLEYIQFGYQCGHWEDTGPHSDSILRVRKYGCFSTSLDSLASFLVVI